MGTNMSRKNRPSAHRLGFESLEGRLLMAGNVTASVVGGDLILTGDSQDNSAQIVQVMQGGQPIAGSYFVFGSNGTTISGGQSFTNVNDDIKINMHGGSDRIVLGNGSNNANFIVPDDLEIDMGDGDDTVVLNRISVRDDATIRTGVGADNVNISASIGGLAGVNSGDNNLTIDTGNNADAVFMQNTFVRRNLTINTGTDNSVDSVSLFRMNIGDDAIINTGDGADNVMLFRVVVTDDLILNTQGGADFVSIDQCQVDELFADLGGGNDRLELTNTVGRRKVLQGGFGVDTILESNSLFSQFNSVNGF